MVRVTEGKMTVTVWKKSTGNQFRFEFAWVQVIGSQLYMYMYLFYSPSNIYLHTRLARTTSRDVGKIFPS